MDPLNQHKLKSTSNWQAHFWMMILSLIVSGSFPVVAAITPGHDPTVLTFWRFLTATAIFGLMVPFVKGFRVPGWKDLGRYFVVGGSYGLFFIFMFESLKETSPINTGTIFTTLPLMTMLLGGLFGEPVRFRQLWILALSMAATLWVIFRGDIHLMLEFKVSRGDWLFFLGTGSLAVYMVAMKKMQRDDSRVYFTFFSLSVATLALLGVAVWRTGGAAFPDAGVWLGIVYLAGPSTAVTFWIIQYATPILGPTRVSGYTFLTPSGVAAIDWGFGLSSPQWVVLPGIGLTLLAVWLLQLESVSGDS